MNRRLPPIDLNDNDPNHPLNQPFTLEELNHVIDKLLKYNKAAGIDKIKAEFLKAAPPWRHTKVTPTTNKQDLFI